MPKLGCTLATAMLVVVAAASFFVALPGAGHLLVATDLHVHIARDAERDAEAWARQGRLDEADQRRRNAAWARHQARDAVERGSGLIVLIAVAGALGAGLVVDRWIPERPGGESGPRRTRIRRACSGLFAAILVGMVAGFLAYGGLVFFLVFVLDD